MQCCLVDERLNCVQELQTLVVPHNCEMQLLLGVPVGMCFFIQAVCQGTHVAVFQGTGGGPSGRLGPCESTTVGYSRQPADSSILGGPVQGENASQCRLLWLASTRAVISRYCQMTFATSTVDKQSLHLMPGCGLVLADWRHMLRLQCHLPLTKILRKRQPRV